MSTKLTDPSNILMQMEGPIRAIRGANETFMSLGTADHVSQGSINFVADALLLEVSKLEGLWRQWENIRPGKNEAEG